MRHGSKLVVPCQTSMELLIPTGPTIPPSNKTTKNRRRRMKRPIHQITCRATLGVATLALTALGGSAASVRGAAVVPPVAPQQPTSDKLDDLRHQHQDQNEYGEEDEDQDRHTPSVAPTAINDMFAQDLANSADELPELWGGTKTNKRQQDATTTVISSKDIEGERDRSAPSGGHPLGRRGVAKPRQCRYCRNQHIR